MAKTKKKTSATAARRGSIQVIVRDENGQLTHSARGDVDDLDAAIEQLGAVHPLEVHEGATEE